MSVPGRVHAPLGYPHTSACHSTKLNTQSHVCCWGTSEESNGVCVCVCALLCCARSNMGRIARFLQGHLPFDVMP